MKSFLKVTLTVLLAAATLLTFYFTSERWSQYARYNQPFSDFAAKAKAGEPGYERIGELPVEGQAFLYKLMSRKNGTNRSLVVFGSISTALMIAAAVLLWRRKSLYVVFTLGGLLLVHVLACVIVKGGSAGEIAVVMAIPVVLLLISVILHRMDGRGTREQRITSEPGGIIAEAEAS